MRNYTKRHLTTLEELMDFIGLFKAVQPKVMAIDTETTGLHTILDRPFLFQFGFVDEETNHGYTYAVHNDDPDLFRAAIKAVLRLADRCQYFIGHNIKYDLHMLENIGFPYRGPNILDTMFCIRMAHDNIPVRFGGAPLGLKPYAAKYIDRDARYNEKLIESERTQISKDLNAKLKQRMATCQPPEFGKYRSWTKGALAEFFRDKLKTVRDLPTHETRQAYQDWLDEDVAQIIQDKMDGPLVETKHIPYTMVSKDVLIRYGHLDIVYTLELYYQTMPVIEVRGQQEGLRREMEVLLPLYRMERTGFKMNQEYIREAHVKLKEYITLLREQIAALVGRPVAIGQTKLILSILNEDYGLPIKSTGKDVIEEVVDKLEHDDPDGDALKFIKLVEKLRTCEKFFSAYLSRFIREMKYTDRIYTTINQVGTASGRVTSDFQQFPKYGIKDDEGNEIFHPRKMIKITGGDYPAIYYLDYSQIELRVQAMYTILVGHPDVNLCRAFMPYECDPSTWQKVDVHSAMTAIAFPDIQPADKSNPEFNKARGMGKRVNFAKNYGAQYGRIKQMFPHLPDEQVKIIDEAYYKAFPGVKHYHQYCYDISSQVACVSNLFGVKYYGMTGHKLINALPQGSSAYFLKDRIVAVDKYIQENNLKTKFQMNIHDELSFEGYAGEEEHIVKLKEIMEYYPDTLVPIVADMEITTTTWAEKVEFETIEEAREILNAN